MTPTDLEGDTCPGTGIPFLTPRRATPSQEAKGTEGRDHALQRAGKALQTEAESISRSLG